MVTKVMHEYSNFCVKLTDTNFNTTAEYYIKFNTASAGNGCL